MAVRARLSRAGLTGPLPGVVVRLSRVGLAGTAVTTLALTPVGFDPTAAEPMIERTINATVVAGTAPDSYLWRRVSGAQVALAAAGASCDVVVPGAFNGTTVTIGCSAVVSGVTGPEALLTITALPHIGFWTVQAGQAVPIGRPTFPSPYTPVPFVLDGGRLDIDTLS